MKRIVAFVLFVFALSFNCAAQYTETGILPPENGKAEEFTEWKKVEFTVDGENLSFEYRIAFIKRKALACNYEIQLKNTSAKKLSIKIKTHYFDKLVNGNYGDEFKETVKAGQTKSFLVITQGCKADKDKKDQGDFERCRACGFSYEIIADLD